MKTVDTLTTKFELEFRQYVGGTREATQATLAHAKAVDALTRKYAELDRAMKRSAAAGRSVPGARSAGRTFGNVSGRSPRSGGAGAFSGVAGAGEAGAAFELIGGAAAVGTAAVLGFVAAYRQLAEASIGPAKEAADWDALAKSLEAVEGNAKEAQKELARLLDLARAPGLGQEEAVRGYTQLRNAGLGQSLTERLIKEFANANAKAGGGPEEFSRIIAQVSQAASKPYLQGEELSTLTENGIPAYKIVKDALGTSDTEELKKRGVTSVQVLEAIAASLEKTARVGGSAKNAFDNLDDTLAAMRRNIGRGENESFGPFVERLSEAIDLANQSGEFTDLGRAIADALGTNDVDDFNDALSNMIAAVKTGVELFGSLRRAVQEVVEPVSGFLDSIGFFDGFAKDTYEANKRGAKADRDMADFQRYREAVRSGRVKLKPGQKLSDGFKEWQAGGGKSSDLASPTSAGMDATGGNAKADPTQKPKGDIERDGKWYLPDGKTRDLAAENARDRARAASSPSAAALPDQVAAGGGRTATARAAGLDGGAFGDLLSGGSVLARNATAEYSLSKITGGRSGLVGKAAQAFVVVLDVMQQLEAGDGANSLAARRLRAA